MSELIAYKFPFNCLGPSDAQNLEKIQPG